MALMIPDAPAKCTGSERQVFRRLERELPEDWAVLHSLGLANHQFKLWGEADFVVISTKGIFVLEVKGGDVACENGVWSFGTPGTTNYYSKNESPFKQAKDAMFALRKVLEERPGYRDLLVGYGVVMPQAVFASEGPEIEQGVLLDHRTFARPLTFYIGRLCRFWDDTFKEKHGVSRRSPSRAEIREIRTLLRPDTGSTLSLGSFLNGLEEELIQLTNRQIQVSRGMDNNPRTIITGRAGTGKTVLAIDRVVRLARSGYSVLYVCFNKLLARHVEASLVGKPGSDRIRVRHLHGLMRDAIVEAGMIGRLDTARVSDTELYGRVFPELFVEAAMVVEPPSAEVLVIDEAQDVLTIGNLDALDLLVRDGLRQGRWSLFLDPLQNIYAQDADAAMAVLREAGYASYELYENCRNTKQVATQASIVSGIDMAMEGAVDGPACDCIFYADREDCISKLGAEVRRLCASDVEPRDLVVLSTRRRDKSLIAGIDTIGGLRVHELAEGSDDMALGFATVHAFKGLERKVVLAIDLDEIGAEAQALLHYAGLSRAIGLLRPFVAVGEKRRYESQAARFGARLAAG
jgi:hypothetical protein